jgi:adenylosuccinate lyase
MPTELTALSPVDGRYAARLDEVRALCSEAALIRWRVQVEARWLEHLATLRQLPALRNLAPAVRDEIRRLATDAGTVDAAAVKEIERRINHDVKAVEYCVRERLRAAGASDAQLEFVHFGCTSEDINNVSYALMLRAARDNVLAPGLQALADRLRVLAHEHADVPMLARTHGQPASPTTVGKEIANFVARVERQRQGLLAVEILAKFNGAVGNFNAHAFAVPDVDWPAVAMRFVESLGLAWQEHTTQIDPHDWIAAYSHAVVRCNTVLIDLCRDTWGYISLGYFRQRAAPGEVGSSTMPHKVNPIDFENAEGNLGVANALFEHFAAKLPVSRWQRDLTDSTVLRNLGVAIGHSALACESIVRGLARLDVDHARLARDLDDAWEVLAEAVQTTMRACGIPSGYEKLKDFTRGQAIDRERLRAFIASLDLPDAQKRRLLELTPATYLGEAARLARNI